ncbi:DUF3147 family protein [Aeoliella sp. SH292]|uniref:DUF3147 family protein n=1 Tax=Aeoliella sp. SH292 TaxID=3454464 RepID=UPI003F94AC6D
MVYVLKVLITTALVVAVSEASRRSTLLGAVFASLPLVSILGMIWLYWDTGDSEKVAALSNSIFWLVLPSLPFFLLVPYLLSRQVGFYTSMTIASGVTVGLYWLAITLLRHHGSSA